MTTLSLQVICKDCKKPCDILSVGGYKKVHKKCCEKVINLNNTCSNKGVEALIINGVIQL